MIAPCVFQFFRAQYDLVVDVSTLHLLKRIRSILSFHNLTRSDDSSWVFFFYSFCYSIEISGVIFWVNYWDAFGEVLLIDCICRAVRSSAFYVQSWGSCCQYRPQRGCLSDRLLNFSLKIFIYFCIDGCIVQQSCLVADAHWSVM